MNSAFVTVFATIGTMLLNTILAYFLGRNQHKKFFNFAYYFFIIGIFIPFQVVMIPLMSVEKLFAVPWADFSVKIAVKNLFNECAYRGQYQIFRESEFQLEAVGIHPRRELLA